MRRGTKIEMSLGDAIDRVSILARKIHFGENGASNEFRYLTESIEKLDIKLTGGLLDAIIKITSSNIDIWNLENEIRKLGDPVAKLGLEEIGRRAMAIRDLNRHRVRSKSEINRMSEMGFREFKINHRSQ